MKKFLTVLLVIAVMFTFSFSSAFAAAAPSADNIAKLYAAEKVMLEQVAKNLTSAITENGDVKTSSYTIEKEVFEALAPSILEDLEAQIEQAIDKEVAGTTTHCASTNYSQSEIIAAMDTVTKYSVANIKAYITSESTGQKWGIEAAKNQFLLDQAEVIKKLDRIDLTLYSTTTPTTGDTYYETAVKAIAKMKSDLSTYKKEDVTDAADAKSKVAELESYFGNYTTAQYVEGTTILSGFYALKASSDIGTAGIKTIKEEANQDVSDAATAAQVKANAQKEYANYVVKAGADKDFAAAYVEVVSFLADQGEVNTTHVTGALDLDTVDTPTIVARYNAALQNVADLTAFAAKMKAEKNEVGELVRDAATVDKLVKNYTTAEYKYAYFAVSQPSKVDAENAIENATVATADSYLAFAKEAAKAAAEDAREDALVDYYALEQVTVNAAYDKYIKAVDAATKVAKIPALSTVSLAGIKTKSDVNTLYTSGALASEYDKLYDGSGNGSLELYLAYKNAGLNNRNDAFVVGTTLDDALQAYLGGEGARTAAEVKALASDAKSVVDALPTVGGIAAAKTEVEAAIKAIPTIVTVADKDAILNAWNLAKDYADMTGVVAASNYTANIANTDIVNRATLATKISDLHSAMALDLAKRSAATSKTDKAALKALADEIEAFYDLYEAEEVFEAVATQYTDAIVYAALDDIKKAELKAVKDAINAIPVNVTEADKTLVENARKLYDAYVAEWTDIDNTNDNNSDNYYDGYAIADVTNFRTLALAEAALGLNYDAEENAKAYVQDLKIAARSTKTSKGVKVTINADVQQLLDDGFTVEYKFYRSTKSNAKFGAAKVTKTENTYLNTSGKKGTKYYYKAKLVVKNAAGEVVATTPLTQCLYATRTF